MQFHPGGTNGPHSQGNTHLTEFHSVSLNKFRPTVHVHPTSPKKLAVFLFVFLSNRQSRTPWLKKRRAHIDPKSSPFKGTASGFGEARLGLLGGNGGSGLAPDGVVDCSRHGVTAEDTKK